MYTRGDAAAGNRRTDRVQTVGDAQKRRGRKLSLDGPLDLRVCLDINAARRLVLYVYVSREAQIDSCIGYMRTKTMIRLLLTRARQSASNCFSPAL